MPPAAAPQPVSRKSTEQPPTNPAPKRDPPAKRPPTLNKSATQPTEKKVSHRSGKPIINWFQRKLAGGSSLVRPKRAENQPLGAQGRPASIPLRPTNRIASAPFPNGSGKPPSKLDVRRKTISLNEDDDGGLYANDLASERSRDSNWSPTSALEADEDASMRPLPPSSPPSPSPSSSSYVSDPRTFRSTAASTKPTTLLSIDLNGNGMAHIAQAPAAPIGRLHVRSSSTNTTPAVVGSGASITFSALPPSPVPSPAEAAARIFSSAPSTNTTSSQTTPHAVSSVQAPLHTAHHPRNNPRPSSPPLDNASVLTLASSAYAVPTRAGVNTPGWSSAPPSALGDSLSHFGGSITYADAESTSQYLLGDDDVDASVRALRPRSSRRGSWESEASRWSARVQQGGAGTPSLARDGRSLWTSNSIRTGGMSADNYVYEKSDEGDDRSEVDTASHNDDKGPESLDVEQIVSPKSDSEPTPRNVLQVVPSIDALHVPLPASTDDLVAGVTDSGAEVPAEPYEDTTPNERYQPLA